MRILVVDHHRASRVALAALLRDDGHDVLESCTGASALANCATSGIDIVVLEIALPDIDGLQVIDEIKRLSRYSQVIVVSGSCYQVFHKGAVECRDYRDEVLGRGAAAYFPKPVHFEELVACMDQLGYGQGLAA